MIMQSVESIWKFLETNLKKLRFYTLLIFEVLHMFQSIHVK